MNPIEEYYSREDVQKFLLEFGKDREVVAVFRDQKFGKRPNILQTKDDILEEVKKGAISFHCSAEKFVNPLALEAGMPKEKIDELRIGWDLVIDIDIDSIEIAKIYAKVFCEFLKQYGIENFMIKYTGNKSFHIIVFSESFPKKYGNIDVPKSYIEISKKIIEYLKFNTKDKIRELLIEFFSLKDLLNLTKKSLNEILDEEKRIDPFKIAKIDIFGLRHLFRMPYAINEKTYRVSIPLNPKEIMNFDPQDATIENVKVNFDFLKKSKEDGLILLLQAIDWFEYKGLEKEIQKEIKEIQEIKGKIKIPFEFFPECIKKILSGLSDGRKRSVFTLITFLRNVGYSMEEIENIIYEWNKRNNPPLRESFIRSQLRWHAKQTRNLLPPNADNELFYKDIGIDHSQCCKLYGFKNPLVYAFKAYKKYLKENYESKRRKDRD